jgi:hypothetical protein
VGATRWERLGGSDSVGATRWGVAEQLPHIKRVTTFVE